MGYLNQYEIIALLTDLYTYDMAIKELSDLLTDRGIENCYNDKYPKSLTVAIDNQNRPLTVMSFPGIGSRLEFFIPVGRLTTNMMYGPWLANPNPKTVKQITLDMGEFEDPAEWSIVYKSKADGDSYSMYHALAFNNLVVTSYFHPSVSNAEQYLEDVTNMYRRHALEYRQEIAEGTRIIVD